MPELTIWKTEEMNRLRRDMGRMLARVWDEFGTGRMPFAPRGLDAIELIDQGNALLLRTEVQDVDPEDLNLIASEDRLTIRGVARDRSVLEKNHLQRTETRFDTFTRSVRLPCQIEPGEVYASFNQGVLEIVLPKREPAPAREIRIRVT
jgi:HSP20 family protein